MHTALNKSWRNRCCKLVSPAPRVCPLCTLRPHTHAWQIFMNESQWNPLSVFYAKTGSVLSEIPPSFNKGGFYIVGSGEVLSPTPAPPPLVPPSPPPPPPSAATALPAGIVAPPAPTPLPEGGSSSSSLSSGAIAGIAVGATCLVLALVGGAVVWRRRHAAPAGAAPDALTPSDSLKLSTTEGGLISSLPTTKGELGWQCLRIRLEKQMCLTMTAQQYGTRTQVHRALLLVS